MSYQLDLLMRSGAEPEGGAATPADPNAVKTEVLRIFATAAMAGGLSTADKSNLSQLVAQRTNLPGERRRSGRRRRQKKRI